MTRPSFIEGTPVPTSLPLHVTDVPADGDAAPGGDRVFVLLHGFGASSWTWRAWAPRLAARGRVLCVDLKGHGAAPRPDDGRYTPHDHADLVVRLVREQGLEGVTLIGHSLGGGVALITALRLLDEGVSPLERLVLVSSPAYRQRLPPFVPLSHRPGLARFLIRIAGPRRVIRSVLRSIVYDPKTVTDAQVEAYAEPFTTAEGVDAIMATGREVVPADIDRISQRIPEITVPVLLLWGDTERVVPGWVADRLHEELPDSELVVLPGCGHVPPEEQPDASWRALSAFLDRTDG